MRALHMSTIAMLPQRVCHFSHCYSPTSSTNASFPHHAARHNLYFAIFHFCCYCCCCNCHHYSAACCCWPQFIRACYFLLFSLYRRRPFTILRLFALCCLHCYLAAPSLPAILCLTHTHAVPRLAFAYLATNLCSCSFFFSFSLFLSIAIFITLFPSLFASPLLVCAYF